MKFLRKIISNPHFWSIAIVLLFSIIAARTLIFQKGYFNMHDDLQMMRQLQMEKCFKDGQIPCRWVPDMGYGFGFPLFNFYPPLPYLIGEVVRLFGFSFISTAKILFALSLIASGVTMYLLAKEFFTYEVKIRGKKINLGALTSSIFYIWVPYHAVDVYVRGAMNESWALAWFPLILWSGYRLLLEKKKIAKWIITLGISWFALLTSHNLMVLIFGPVFALWIIFWMWREQRWSGVLPLVRAGILAFGLAAFFTLPAVFENKFTQIRGQLVGYYDYTAHFVDLNQLLITRFWGYGPSVWDVRDDGMSFQIGHVHWILSLFIGAWVIYRLFKISKNKRNPKLLSTYYLLVGFLIIGWASAFMTHSRSTPIWQLIPPIGLLQFPWRFLTIIVFSFSFLAGSIVLLIKNKKLLNSIIGLLVLGLVALNWNYFLPEHGRMGKLTDEEKFSAAAWDLQQTAGIYDYLPSTAETAPKESRKALVEVLKGEATNGNEKEGTNWAEFDTSVVSETAVLRLGIFKFPGWKVFVDGKEIESYIPTEEKWGRMWVDVPEGEHKVKIRLYNTWPRTLGNTISLISWVGLITYPVWKKKLISKK